MPDETTKAIIPRVRHPGGRPTDYHPIYCETIVEFFSKPLTEQQIKSITKKVTQNGTVSERAEFGIVAANLPTFTKFARYIGVDTDTLVEWTKVHPEFSVSYKKCKELQKDFLIDNALAGRYNPAAFIFTAKNITDMRDDVKHDHDVQVVVRLTRYGEDDRLAPVPTPSVSVAAPQSLEQGGQETGDSGVAPQGGQGFDGAQLHDSKDV